MVQSLFRAHHRTVEEVSKPATIRSSQVEPHRLRSRDKTKLNRALPAWQIIMIAIGGVIGVTIFSTHGYILEIAGPGGLLIATIFVALTMICVMECIGEMVIMWPVSNAMVEYVRAFVDEDLAIVIGIAYWYTFSCIFATLIIVAAEFSTYWISQLIWRIVIFYLVIPLLLLFINIMGVKWYGWVEGIGGFVKILMVVSGLIIMIVDAPKAQSTNIDDGFAYSHKVADGSFEAICIAVPLISYGYIGTEIVSVTAFEAKNRQSLRNPARWVSYIIAFLYLSSALLESVVVSRTSTDLPAIDKRADGSPTHAGPGFYPVIVIAAREYNSASLGWYLTSCIIYFCISAANTALYVSSRTLFGLTRELNKMEDLSWYFKVLRYFGVTSPFARVPHYALIASFLAFYWLIPLQSVEGYAITDILTIMSSISSVGGIIVWASQCVAYIRYHHWFHNFKKLDELPQEYNRWNPQPNLPGAEWHKSRTFMASIQPLPAWFGLIGCFLIVFVFSSANWWQSGEPPFKRIATAYASPVILLIIFIILKIVNRGRRTTLAPNDTNKLHAVIRHFEGNVQLDDEDGADAEHGMAQQIDMDMQDVPTAYHPMHQIPRTATPDYSQVVYPPPLPRVPVGGHTHAR